MLALINSPFISIQIHSFIHYPGYLGTLSNNLKDLFFTDAISGSRPPYNPEPPRRPLVEVNPQEARGSPGGELRVQCFARGSDWDVSWTRQGGQRLPDSARVEGTVCVLMDAGVKRLPEHRIQFWTLCIKKTMKPENCDIG